ncbi:MAG TPA: hypothetical protein VJ957_02825 [Longimicrobiales bacterium]|nr:hypothetical protein [Longimicrobiales bacterium]
MNASRTALRRTLVVLGALAAAAPVHAAAQQVQRQGAADVALDRRLARMLASGHYTLIATDTFVGVGDTIPQDALVLDATLVLEGTVRGDLVVVDGGVFLRPGARVAGDMVNIGGGLYRSMDARIGGHIIDLPDAPYHVTRADGELRIVAREQPARVKLDSPVLGFHVPTYDRVDALTLGWGAGFALPQIGAIQPQIRGWVGYRTQRGKPAGGAELRLRAGAYELRGGIERATSTNDGWNRRNGYNSTTYLWNGNDYRDYYGADRRFVLLSRDLGDVEKRFHATLHVGAQLEDAVSLAGGDPWHVVGPAARPNPPIDDGRIASGLAGIEASWISHVASLTLSGTVEAARKVNGGEFRFNRFETGGAWAMQAIAHHTLEVRWQLMGPLPGTDSLPRQRYSILGGVGTLPVYDIAAFRGDRLVFVQTRYLIPLPDWLALPVLGAPDLELVDALGSAWTAFSPHTRLEQNVGVGLEFFGAFARYMVDARDTNRGTFSAGLVWPFGARYPWRPR